MASVEPTCAGFAGRVTAFTSDAPAPVLITFQYGNQAPQPIRTLGIATGLRVNQQVAAQFQLSLSDSIYVTPFGDAVGDIVLGFLANPRCAETEETLSILEHYVRMRLRPTQIAGATLIYTPKQIVTVGRTSFAGYIVAVNYDAQAGSSVQISGSLIMKAWPV